MNKHLFRIWWTSMLIFHVWKYETIALSAVSWNQKCVVTMSIKWWLEGWFYLSCCDNWLPGWCSPLGWWLSLVTMESQDDVSTQTWRGVKLYSNNRTYFSGLFFLPFLFLLFHFCLHNCAFFWKKYLLVASQNISQFIVIYWILAILPKLIQFRCLWFIATYEFYLSTVSLHSILHILLQGSWENAILMMSFSSVKYFLFTPLLTSLLPKG